MAAVTGTTNLAMVPTMILAFRRGFYFDSIVGAMAMLTSSAYHVCQSLRVNFLGFNEGRYHHMDNVFAILALCSVIVSFAQFPPQNAAKEVLNTLAVCAAIVSQLMSPWDVKYTIVPLVGMGLIVIPIAVRRSGQSRRDERSGRLAVVCLAFAIICFVKGLDDHTDWLRLWHGAWHVFIGGVSYFTFNCNYPPKGHVFPSKEP